MLAQGPNYPITPQLAKFRFHLQLASYSKRGRFMKVRRIASFSIFFCLDILCRKLMMLKFGDLQFEDLALLKCTRNVFIQKLYMLRQAGKLMKNRNHQPNSSR